MFSYKEKQYELLVFGNQQNIYFLWIGPANMYQLLD